VTLKVYLDICCLKRSFDDQSQPRIAVESAAVLAVLVAAERGAIELLRSAAHYAENAADPGSERRAALNRWLEAGAPPETATDAVRDRFAVFRRAGIGQMDALHLAWAEHLGADVLLTTDDRLASKAARLAHTLRVRVMNPVIFAKELRQ
jgi:predicted nucleic acid-binding protein